MQSSLQRKFRFLVMSSTVFDFSNTELVACCWKNQIISDTVTVAKAQQPVFQFTLR